MSAVTAQYVTANMKQNQSARTSKSSQSRDFQACFNTSLTKADRNMAKKMISKSDITKGRDIRSNTQSKEKLYSDDDSRKKFESRNEVKNSNKADSTQNVEKKSNKKVDSKIVENENQLKEEIEDTVMKEVAEALGVTKEELLKIMEDSGITVMDLFSKQGLKEMLVEMFDISDDYDLLGNSSYLETFKDLKDLLNQDELKNLKKMYVKLEKELLNETSNEEVVKQNLVLEIADNELDSNNNQKESLVKTEVNQTEVNQTEVKVIDEKVEVIDMRDKNLIVEGKEESSTNNQQQNSFSDLFANAINEKTTETIVRASGDVVFKQISAEEILDQVVTKVRVELGNKNTSMSIQLTPENLGKVAFSVSSENGVMTGSIVAENNAVKEILEMNLTNLKVQLEEQGLKMEEVKVVVGNSNQFFDQKEKEQQFNQSQQKRTRKISRVRVEEEVDVVEENESLSSIDNDYSVEYTA